MFSSAFLLRQYKGPSIWSPKRLFHLAPHIAQDPLASFLGNIPIDPIQAPCL